MRMVTEKSGTVWTKGLRARECLGELATTKRMGASKERVTTIEEPAKTRRPQEDQDRWRKESEDRSIHFMGRLLKGLEENRVPRGYKQTCQG